MNDRAKHNLSEIEQMLKGTHPRNILISFDDKPPCTLEELASTTKLGAIEDFGKRISEEAELLQERSAPRKARLTERKERGEER